MSRARPARLADESGSSCKIHILIVISVMLALSTPEFYVSCACKSRFNKEHPPALRS